MVSHKTCRNCIHRWACAFFRDKGEKGMNEAAAYHDIILPMVPKYADPMDPESPRGAMERIHIAVRERTLEVVAEICANYIEGPV